MQNVHGLFMKCPRHQTTPFGDRTIASTEGVDNANKLKIRADPG